MAGHGDLLDLLKSANEPQPSRLSRSKTVQNKSKTSKENKSGTGKTSAPSKTKAEVLPVNPAKVERLFNKFENAVFAPQRRVGVASEPQPQLLSTPKATLKDLDSLRRLAISCPGDIDSPMSIDRGHNRSSPFSPAMANEAAVTPISPLPPPAMSPQPTFSQAAELSYRHRCSSDSDAMLASCPAHLSHVNQTYLKQADAFTLADQCNAGLPLLPEPRIMLSSVVDLPSKRPLSAAGGKSSSGGLVSGPNSPTKPQPPSEGHAATAGPQIPVASGADGATNNSVDAGIASVPAAPRYGFSLEQYNGPLGASGARKVQEESESEKKRARSEAAAASVRQMQEDYMAALAQLNGPRPGEVSSANAERPSKSGKSSDLNGESLQAAAAVSGPSPPSGDTPANKTFAPRQLRQEAIHVFCVEKPNERTGLFYRNFTATSYASVWRAYINAQRPGTLHWYEVVREGRPCHLYFDLEYRRGQDYNTHIDGDAMVDALVRHVGALFARNWGIVLDPATQVYELDSSTQEKFSRHVIVRLPGHAFYHNLAVGHFVAQVLAAAGAELDVAKDPPPSIERTSFVDTAVYTRNRHFRLAYSCKGGKSAVLSPTSRYATADGANRPSPAKVFSNTLICNVEEGAVLLAVLPPLENPGPRVAAGIAAGGGSGIGVSTSGGGVYTGDVSGRVVAWKNDEIGRRDSGASGSGDKEKIKKLKALAEAAVPFIERAASRRGGEDARARTVAFCGNDGLVAYSMIGPGSHFCENIGRAHRHNHVYYVVNFSLGTYAQKCHDPDCSRFRSAWMPLPEGLCLNAPSGGSEEQVQLK